MAQVKEEERIARLEEKVEHLSHEIQEIKKDVKDLKEDLHRVEISLREELHRLDKKFTILILIVIFLIVFLNQSALEFFFRVIGLLK